MTRRRGALAVLAVLALAGLVSTFTGPDLSPVPTEAGSSFICDGVPAEGPALILGGDVEVGRDSDGGTWGKGSGFFCTVTSTDGSTAVMIEESDPASRRQRTPEGMLRHLSRTVDPEPIHADAPGAGYVFGSTSPMASWVCGERVISAVLLRGGVEERDAHADVEALVVSMLPWACGDQDVPRRTVDRT